MTQGCSIATAVKEWKLQELIDKRVQVFLESDKQTLNIADIFCGCGTNFTDDCVIPGSPIIITERAVLHSNKIAAKSKKVVLHFNDLDKNKVTALRKKLNKYDGFSQGDTVSTRFHTMSADKCTKLVMGLSAKEHKILFIDPNNLSELPYTALMDELTAHESIGDSTDLIMHVPYKQLIRYTSRKRQCEEFKATSWFTKDIEDEVDFFDKFSDIFNNGYLNGENMHGSMGWVLFGAWNKRHNTRKGKLHKIF